MFLVLFSILLLLANIYCFVKKKYLYLFIPCMLFLPDYYGLELSAHLPILTVTRIMYLVFFLYVFINRKKTIDIKSIQITEIPQYYLFIAGYCFFRIMSNLFYIAETGHAAKTIFCIIFEQLFFLIAIYMLAPTKDEILLLIKCIVNIAAILFIIGIFESITYVKPFDSLYTVSRVINNEYYIRLGLLRSVTTMGMPGLFSNMCLMILPLTIYLYNESQQKRYLAIVVLDILAGIHSGARAFLVFLALIILVYLALVLETPRARLQFIKSMAGVLVTLCIVVGIGSLCNPHLKYFYSGSVKAILNEVGFDFDLDADAPEGVEGYGKNAKVDGEKGGVFSRLVQLSGIEYSLKTNPLFGLGHDVFIKHKIHYYYIDEWKNVDTIDLGIVEILVMEGILGLIGYISLFLFIFSCIKVMKSTFDAHFLLMLVFTYLLTTLTTVNMQNFLMLIVALSMGFRKNIVTEC